MNATLKPTGLMLVGVAFLLICLCSQIGTAWPASPSYPDSLDTIKEYHSDFIHHRLKPADTGQLPLSGNTVSFPWSIGRVPGSGPVNERIILDGSRSIGQVHDLKAMNSAKQRDIVYADSQRKGPESQSLVNSMDVRVAGDYKGKKELSKDGIDDDGLERFVDTMSGVQNGIAPRSSSPGNYLNVDVSGITVSAINTVEGGSAVATSNIIIKPVQVIVCQPEVAEKLE